MNATIYLEDTPEEKEFRNIEATARYAAGEHGSVNYHLSKNGNTVAIVVMLEALEPADEMLKDIHRIVRPRYHHIVVQPVAAYFGGKK
jgi:hypothetical protein